MKRLLPFFLVCACAEQPTTVTPREVSWHEAQSLLRACKVESGHQGHDLVVLLNLTDGTTIQTLEPQIDAVLDTERLAPGCPPVLFWIE